MKTWVVSRWRGEAPLGTVFWRDMMLFGTILNAATTMGAVGVLAAGAPTALAVIVFLMPLPWNVFIFCSVWRSAGRATGLMPASAQMAAIVWLIAATTL